MKIFYYKSPVVVVFLLPIILFFVTSCIALAGGGGGDPGFVIESSTSILEGDSGSSSTANVNVLLFSVPDGTYTIDYETIDGSATVGEDYEETSGTLTIVCAASNCDTGHVLVSIIGDSEKEINETLTVSFSNPVGTAIVGGTTSQITINNDDYNIYHASNLLGQIDGEEPDFTAKVSGTSSREFSFLDDYGGLFLDAENHRLFVADGGNNRVLIFELDEFNKIDSYDAVNVLGQDDFESGASDLAQDTFNRPAGIVYDDTHERLFVADSVNNRVLVFDTSSISDGMPAVNVLGQDDFESNTTDVLNDPRSLAYDPTNNRLFVGNYNDLFGVKVFDTAVIEDGEAPVVTLGLGETDASSFIKTTGLAYDPTNNLLFVASESSHSVFVFNGHPMLLSNNVAAIKILGNESFETTSCHTGPTTQDGLCLPSALFFDDTSDYLFIGDNSQRVLMFDTSSIDNGEDAEALFGAETYETLISSGTTVNGSFQKVISLGFDSTNHVLYVGDGRFKRIQEFDFINIPEQDLPDGETGTAYSEIIDVEGSQGYINFTITAGSLPIGLSLDENTGEISGTPTNPGGLTFTVRVTDTGIPDIDDSFAASRQLSLTINQGTEEEEGDGGGDEEQPRRSSGGTASQSFLAQRGIVLSDNNATPNSSQNSDNNSVKKVLRFKTIDAQVKLLQQLLNKDSDTAVALIGLGSKGNETNYFGPKTLAAVKKFQLKHGLVADGIVGPKTWAELVK